MWHKYQDDPDADGDVPDGKAVGPRRLERQELTENDDEEKENLIRKKYVAPRRFKITKEDAEAHGYTRGCAACVSWFRGRGRQAHTHECRARFELAMKEEAKVKRAAEQKLEFERSIAAKINYPVSENPNQREN